MRRRFSAGEVLHIYQRTISGFNLFYSVEDFLVFYTIVSIKAKRHQISLMALCQMIDHVHLLVSADDITRISCFVSEYSSLYVREFNSWTGRKGALFSSAYGSAAKTEAKKIRSAIAYLFNNPVEKKLCSRAEGYKWNYLAYYDLRRRNLHRPTDHFSRTLTRAIKLVDYQFKSGRYLKHAFIHNLIRTLGNYEKEFLINHISSLYFPFDVEKTCSFYKSHEEMIRAINSNTGSEYDIAEHHYCKSDAPYREIISILKSLGIDKIQEVIVYSEDRKKQLLALLKSKTSASGSQIKKFLHMEQRRTTR